MTDYVTRSGRARPTGRVTRLAYTVGKPKRVKPLPLHMSVRPQALTPLPRNPGCSTYYPVSGAFLHFRERMSGAEYGLGIGLSGRGKWSLYVQSCHGHHGTYRHHDSVEALEWARAAEHNGYTVTVTEA